MEGATLDLMYKLLGTSQSSTDSISSLSKGQIRRQGAQKEQEPTPQFLHSQCSHLNLKSRIRLMVCLDSLEELTDWRDVHNFGSANLCRSDG